MFGPGSLQQSMRQLDKAETEEAFESAVCGLRSYLKSIEAVFDGDRKKGLLSFKRFF